MIMQFNQSSTDTKKLENTDKLNLNKDSNDNNSNNNGGFKPTCVNLRSL